MSNPATPTPDPATPTPDPATPSADATTARVHVLTRAGCHLCEDALAIVERVCAATGTTVRVTDIDATGDPGLLDLYSDQVPVTFVDGAVHDFWRVDEARLRAALRRPPVDSPA